MDFSLIAQANNARKANKIDPPQTLRLENVQVFDGQKFVGPTTISIHHGQIVNDLPASNKLNCSGKYLVPGLIDAHSHPILLKDLEALTRHGITTTMSMAGFNEEHMASLKGQQGLVDVIGAGLPATAPGSKHAAMPFWPKDELLTEAGQADLFVQKQIRRGADFIKILSDIPGLSQDTVSACVDAAREHKKLSVVHAASLDTARIAINSKCDQMHHCPLDGVFALEDLKLLQSNRTIVCPTLTMMQAVLNNMKGRGTYENARDCVTALQKAGIPILCGTDANEAPGSPARVPYGSSIHQELELLVDAGLTPAQALESATLLPARHFDLNDRGVIAPGYRADLVLLSANPLEDITATKKIEKVWAGGIQVV